eukprot:6078897-Pyramimonas_sp.AAC.1
MECVDLTARTTTVRGVTRTTPSLVGPHSIACTAPNQKLGFPAKPPSLRPHARSNQIQGGPLPWGMT